MQLTYDPITQIFSHSVVDAQTYCIFKRKKSKALDATLHRVFKGFFVPSSSDPCITQTRMHSFFTLYYSFSAFPAWHRTRNWRTRRHCEDTKKKAVNRACTSIFRWWWSDACRRWSCARAREVTWVTTAISEHEAIYSARLWLAARRQARINGMRQRVGGSSLFVIETTSIDGRSLHNMGGEWHNDPSSMLINCDCVMTSLAISYSPLLGRGCSRDSRARRRWRRSNRRHGRLLWIFERSINS